MPRRVRLVEARRAPPGSPPGALLPRAENGVPAARLSAFHYDADTFEELPPGPAAEADLPALRARTRAHGTTWINLDGVADTAAVAALGEAFGLHPLVQEDLANPAQRPKLELYGDYVFVVARMVRPAETPPLPGEPHYTVEQVAFVLGEGYVLSFQEVPGDVFEPVRERIRRASGRVRQHGPDYLLYALLDVIVDHYLVTLERIGDATEALEERVASAHVAGPRGRGVQMAISALRRDVVQLRRAVWPLREVLAALLRDDVPGVSERTRLYLRDAYDHLVQTVEILEALRDVLGGLADLYLTAISLRQNEVMKTLTVVSSVFIPLTFVAGIYGMNFDNMPELHTPYGYFVLLGAMATLAASILLFFRRKGWL